MTQIRKKNKQVSIRSRHKQRKSCIPHWIRDYSIEIGSAFAILFAIFLLIEPWEIRKTVSSLAGRSTDAILKATSAVWHTVFRWLGGLSLSDAIAIILLAGVIITTALRLRWRLNRWPRLQSTHCPRCNAGALKRIHRRWLERPPALFGIPVRRFWCGRCGWRGLRIQSRIKSNQFSNPSSDNIDRTTIFNSLK